MKVITPPIVDLPESASRLREDPEGFLTECREQYGLFFTVIVEQEHRITYVLDPHLFQPLLTAPQVDFSPASRQSKLRFGLGSVVATKEEVKHLSRDFIYALRGKALTVARSCFREVLDEAVHEFCATLPSEMTIQQMVHQTLMPATVEALFGEGIYDANFTEDFLAYASSIATRFAGSDPKTADQGLSAEKALRGRLKKPLAESETLVMRQLREGVLSRPHITEDERLGTLLMLMWGSMVNLIPTSVWMYATVIADPELVNSLRGKDGALLSESVVTETLRLFSRPNMYRQISSDFILAAQGRPSVQLRAGDWVALFPRFLHHDPDVFKQPRTFHGERFCPSEGKKPTFEYDGTPLRNPTVVFGFGEGRCPGDAYAQNVLNISLQTWCRAFDAHLKTSELPPAVTKTPASTPGPTGEIPAIFQPRPAV